MKLKLFTILLSCLLVFPLSNLSSSNDLDECTIEVYNCFGMKLFENKIDELSLLQLETEILNGNFSSLGLKWDFGFASYIISYGKGKVYIPLKNERTFFRFFLRPIIFNYYGGGFTLIKLGANYVWKGKTIGDFGFMTMDQWGMMLGFFGLHVRIRWLVRPETHIFVGSSLMIAGYDKML